MTMQAIPIEPDLIARHGLKADEYQLRPRTDLPEPGIFSPGGTIFRRHSP
ncbi:hypothetical protein [Rhizobium leguminosarum]|nr:hypothetical protein [Rhizobium leguminosarum]MBY2998438.1 hypothetical protein [Rhizobium leguminosarum]